MKRILVPIFIVVEPFHFAPAAPAPAPAPALHCTGTLQFVAKKNLKNFTSKITGPCFIHSKVRVLCFHLKGQINLLHEIVVMFVAYRVFRSICWRGRISVRIQTVYILPVLA